MIEDSILLKYPSVNETIKNIFKFTKNKADGNLKSTVSLFCLFSYFNIYCAVSIIDSTVLIALLAFFFSLGLLSTAFLPMTPTAIPAASPIAAPFTTFIIEFELTKHTSVFYMQVYACNIIVYVLQYNKTDF